jgi:PKD repeat protein
LLQKWVILFKASFNMHTLGIANFCCNAHTGFNKLLYNFKNQSTRTWDFDFDPNWL